MPAAGPPWEIPVRHVSADLVTYALWLAALLGAGGVVAGLLAIHRGARLSARILLVAGLIAVAVLTVLPPAGSTDALDYATYGRLLALGHSPYVTTPVHLRHLHNAFALSVPRVWDHYVSVYGPLATMEQFLAAKLGGASAGPDHVLAQAVGLGRVRGRGPGPGPAAAAPPGQRLRAHLLWTVNPLLLWDLVAAGHLDVLAVAAGLLGLLVLGEQHAAARPALVAGRRPRAPSSASPPTSRSTTCCSGWARPGPCAAPSRRWPWRARRRSRCSCPATPTSGCPRSGPCSAGATRAAPTTSTGSSCPHGWHHDLGMIATVLVVAVAILALRRLPAGRGHASGHPAHRGPLRRLAVPVALPAALVRRDAHLRAGPLPGHPGWTGWCWPGSTAGTISNMPGNPYLQHSHLLRLADHFAVRMLAPMVMLAAAIALVALCLTGRWKLRDSPAPEAPGPGDAGVLAAAAGPVS